MSSVPYSRDAFSGEIRSNVLRASSSEAEKRVQALGCAVFWVGHSLREKCERDRGRRGENPKRSRRDVLILRVKGNVTVGGRNNERYPIVRYTLPHPSSAFGSSHVEGHKLLAGSSRRRGVHGFLPLKGLGSYKISL